MFKWASLNPLKRAIASNEKVFKSILALLLYNSLVSLFLFLLYLYHLLKYKFWPIDLIF